MLRATLAVTRALPPGDGLAERRSILHNAVLRFKFPSPTLRYEESWPNARTVVVVSE